MTAPDGQEIQIAGDPPRRGAMRLFPAILAALGLFAALVGTLPPQAWSWTEWRPSPSLFAIADWAFLSTFFALGFAALALTIVVLWVGRRPIRHGMKKLMSGELSWQDVALMVAITLLALVLVTLFMRLGWLDPGFLDLRWPSFGDPESPDLEGLPPGATPPGGFMQLSETMQRVVGFLTSVLGLGLVAVGFFCLVIWMMNLRARAQTRAAPREDDPLADALATATDESLDDLAAGGDPRAAIVGCYLRFERSLAAAKIGRAPWQTPLEVMRAALSALPVAAEDVERLTRLFERARFSPHPMGGAEVKSAWQSLSAIRSSLARKADADA